jgi:hypothetical protein
MKRKVHPWNGMQQLLDIVAILGTERFVTNLLQSVARMATPCNKTIIMFFY